MAFRADTSRLTRNYKALCFCDFFYNSHFVSTHFTILKIDTNFLAAFLHNKKAALPEPLFYNQSIFYKIMNRFLAALKSGLTS